MTTQPTQSEQIADQTVTIHRYNTIIVGSGAAGMNCAVSLYEQLQQKDITDPHEKIAVVTAGLSLGASRMSGSDKQTYYKMGTSPDTPDTADQFAKSLTDAGACHYDLALTEAIGSLRGFYHLVQAGVPFPHDKLGTYIGYKTDHDPYERATSAGPKTSKMMSHRLEHIARQYNIKIHDKHELAHIITQGSGNDKRIIGIVTIHKPDITNSTLAINVFYCANLVLAAGGPGALYQTSVYPKGQIGIHGLALLASLAAENLTESQFGLASTKFRWNVSGTYMQVIPRIFSTDAQGNDPRDFLNDFFPSMSALATAIFLKGYQWPFDPQRIENHQSSLIDVLVFNETQKGRRVFMDFLNNPTPTKNMSPFKIDDLQPEALDYLNSTSARQPLPIDRLKHMNPLAIDIYSENSIDLHLEPLEIAVCAQHSNGGFAVDKWWQSTIPGTFIIGEMAGTHGIKRPGGSALNAGQVGAQRAAQFIANARPTDTPPPLPPDSLKSQLTPIITNLIALTSPSSSTTTSPSAQLTPQQAITQIQQRMTAQGGHIRQLDSVKSALKDAVALYKNITTQPLKLTTPKDIITAIQAQHLALTSVATLKAILELLNLGSGSRGSHLVLSPDGIEVHPDVIDPATKTPLRYKPENESLRSSILRVTFDPSAPHLFTHQQTPLRPAPTLRKAFEPAWLDFRNSEIYSD